MEGKKLKFTDETFIGLPENYAGPYRIPNGIKTIAKFAFNICEFLTSIEIPNSVISIGDRAFYGCKGLKSITIPDSVTSIGVQTFGECSRLKSITIPDSVTSIGNGAFEMCKKLKSITIPDSVTSIGHGALLITEFSENEIKQIYHYVNEKGPKEKFKTFVHQTSAEAQTAQESTSPNKVYLYRGYQDETEVHVPNTFTAIGYEAFKGHTRLTSIEIPSSVTNIGHSAFEGCTELTSIEIPSSVTSIGLSAFRGCKKLTSIEIPSSITSIELSAFEGCTGLTSIEIPSSVTSISFNAFAGCTELTSIEIPSGVTKIGSGAMGGCTFLTNVAVLGTDTTISWPLFPYCLSLKKLILKSRYYSIENGMVYNRARTELFEFIPSLSNSNTIKINDKVQIIHSFAFCALKAVKSIELPRYLRYIQHEAFDFESSKVQLILNTDNPAQIAVTDNRNLPIFKNLTPDCSLVVPVGSGYAYRHHPVWGQFKTITTAPIDWDAES